MRVITIKEQIISKVGTLKMTFKKIELKSGWVNGKISVERVMIQTISKERSFKRGSDSGRSCGGRKGGCVEGVIVKTQHPSHVNKDSTSPFTRGNRKINPEAIAGQALVKIDIFTQNHRPSI